LRIGPLGLEVRGPAFGLKAKRIKTTSLEERFALPKNKKPIPFWRIGFVFTVVKIQITTQRGSYDSRTSNSSSFVISTSLKIFDKSPGPIVSPECTGTTVARPSSCFRKT
jgi:hypothetical protein